MGMRDLHYGKNPKTGKDKHGKDRRSQFKYIPLSTLAEMIKMREEGASFEAIGEKHGFSRTTIRLALRARGL